MDKQIEGELRQNEKEEDEGRREGQRVRRKVNMEGNRNKGGKRCHLKKESHIEIKTERTRKRLRYLMKLTSKRKRLQERRLEKRKHAADSQPRTSSLNND